MALPLMPKAATKSPPRSDLRRSEGDDRNSQAAASITWIFGSGRSGTTWLGSMLSDLPRYEIWNEPLVGSLFGDFYRKRNGDRRGDRFILAPALKHLWIESLRSMVLTGAAARFPDLLEGGQLVIKEPHGSMGADFLSEALPESRMILMIRDPRDVIASALDAHRRESWTAGSAQWRGRRKPKGRAEKNPDRFVRSRAANYARTMRIARAAYESHPGPKALISYEGLRTRTLDELRRLRGELEIRASDEDLARVVAARSWEAIPAAEKGPGRFYRKGAVGAWREDLSAQQVEVIERIARPVLDEFYA